MGLFDDVDWGDVSTGVAGVSEALTTWTGENGNGEEPAPTTEVVQITDEDWFWPVFGVGAALLIALAFQK
jgi:hypothetical protein